LLCEWFVELVKEVILDTVVSFDSFVIDVLFSGGSESGGGGGEHNTYRLCLYLPLYLAKVFYIL
jgi:hypothetical protein